MDHLVYVVCKFMSFYLFLVVFSERFHFGKPCIYEPIINIYNNRFP